MARKPTSEELEQRVNDLKQKAAKPQQAEQERRWKQRRASDQAVREAIEYAEAVVDTVREPLVVLNGDLRVHSANRSFYQVFKVKPEETLGEFIYDLGNRQWDISKLRELLEEILPQNTRFHGFEVEHDFESIGKKVMLLNARRIKRRSEGTELILLAMEDITDRKRAEQERIQKEKLEAILEMAGAVCHELNQPLQVVSVSLEPLLRAISKDSPLYNRTQKIEEKIDTIAGITRKLQTMTKYETKDYIEGTKIIDIDKALS